MQIFLEFKDKYEEYFQYLAREGRNHKTIAEHRKMLCTWFPAEFKNRKLSKIKRADISLLKEVGREHGEHGETRAVVAFRRYADFLQSELNLKLPFDWRDVRVPLVRDKEQPVFEDNELATLFNVMETMEIGSVHGRRMAWTMKAYFEFLFGTGLRMHEALARKRTEFPQMEQTTKITVLRKGNKICEVSISERAISKLREYLSRRNDTSDALFVNSCGEPLIPATAKSYFYRLRKKLIELGFAEIAAKLRSHTFRRTLATHLLENGADIKAVQVIMDHASPRVTLRHYVRANKRRAHLLHKSILANIPFDQLAKRYKENNGVVSVRTTANGGRWMDLNEENSRELTLLMADRINPGAAEQGIINSIKKLLRTANHNESFSTPPLCG